MLENPNIKRLEKLAEELQAIAPILTSEDKMQAALDNLVSLRTIERYLNGEPKKLRIAERLLQYFRKQKKLALAS
jgi:hypothetical protein